jgi:hypothetical protein
MHNCCCNSGGVAGAVGFALPHGRENQVKFANEVLARFTVAQIDNDPMLTYLKEHYTK